MAKIKPKPEVFSDALRKRVRGRLAYMAVALAGRAVKGAEGPLAANQIGIAYSTLWRFLHRGKGLSTEATDKVVAWLDRSET